MISRYFNRFQLSVWDILFSLFLAFMFTVSPQYIATGSAILAVGTILHFILYFLAFLAATAIIRYVLKNLNFNIAFFQRLLNHKHALFILAGIMFLLWLPVMIILYPGTVINDTWGQLSQFVYTFYSDSKIHFEYLGDHHPVLTTFIMGWLIIPLANLIGNLQVAMFVYVIIQAILTCLAFSYSLLYAHRKLKIGSGLAFIFLLIYAIHPILPGSVQTISKDSLNAWIFVFFTVSFLEVIRTKGESLDSAYRFDLLILLSWACCVTKKVSFYVVILSLLLALLVIRRNRKKIIVMLVVGVALMQFIWPAVMNMTGITSGGKTEMLSLPYQMTARYVKEHPDDVSPEEYAVLDKMLSMGSLADRYDPVSADPVKGFAFYERFEGSDYTDYIKVWVSQGLRHQGSYINALLAMESGWFSWTKYYPVIDMNWHSQLNTNFFSEASTIRPEPIKTWASVYQRLLDKLYEIPVVGLLFTYGLYAVLIPAFVIATLLRSRKKGMWVGALPMFFSLALGCWLAPVSIHFEGRRYLYPITYSALLLIAWCRYAMKEEESGQKAAVYISATEENISVAEVAKDGDVKDGQNSSTDPVL